MGCVPGLNDVIRGLVMELVKHYDVTGILGYRNGFAGLVPGCGYEPFALTPALVHDINAQGGTILGSSRGAQDPDLMVDQLLADQIDILFVIGGDGSMRGAMGIAAALRRREIPIGVIGIPKTIDNDIPVHRPELRVRHRLQLGREDDQRRHGRGPIRHRRCRHGQADGPQLRIHRLLRRAGQPRGGLRADSRGAVRAGRARAASWPRCTSGSRSGGARSWWWPRGPARRSWPRASGTDASGNARLGDIGLHLKAKITEHFAAQGSPLNLKYIDPGYLIRSVRADAHDSVYCVRLAQAAVHAGMAGRTDMVVGRRHNRFIHVPIAHVVSECNQVAPDGDLWLSVLESTAQPMIMGEHDGAWPSPSLGRTRPTGRRTSRSGCGRCWRPRRRTAPVMSASWG